MASDSKYPFLELVRESEAVARGANLSDKINYNVYHAVKKAATPQAARSGQLFTIDSFVPDIVNLTKKDLQTVLKRLIGDGLIVQIFRLEYVPDQPIVKMTPCFIANIQDGEDTTYQLYQETVQQSVLALESLLESIPRATPDAFWKDLETDFNMDRIPEPSELPVTIADLFSPVHAGSFDIVPPAELLTITRREIEAELARKGRVLEINDYGYMPVREAEILERLETAGDFLKRKVIPKYKTRSNLKRDLEQINLEEAAYKVDQFAPDTAEFIAKRASAVKKAVLATPGTTGTPGVRFPGILTLEVLIGLEQHAKERYEEARRKANKEELSAFKQKLMDPTAPWTEQIRFVEQAETRDFSPENWKDLTGDPELIYGTWHLPSSMIHVFIRNEASAFRALTRGMQEGPAEQNWKILAMKSLLEKSEDRFKALFDDAEFVAAYGRILRNAYVNYFPWIYRILMMIGLNMFLDRSFQIAKAAIAREQGALEKPNRERQEKLEKERDEEKQEKLLGVKDLAVANRIIEKLDEFYIGEKWIPTVGEIRRELPDILPQTFNAIMRKESFQIIPAGRDQDPNLGILLYPMNHEWRTRTARLRKVLDEIFTFDTEAADPDIKMQVAAAKKVQKFITRTEAGGGAAAR